MPKLKDENASDEHAPPGVATVALTIMGPVMFAA
jgi:hypothetical protein